MSRIEVSAPRRARQLSEPVRERDAFDSGKLDQSGVQGPRRRLRVLAFDTKAQAGDLGTEIHDRDVVLCEGDSRVFEQLGVIFARATNTRDGRELLHALDL